MKKIAFVNQRYGLEVNGGSEYYTRLIAEHLTSCYEVHVITTKALDYMTWKDYYTESEEVIHDVYVHRFPVDHPRNQSTFDEINAKMLTSTEHTIEDEKRWVEEQGPVSSKLVQYIVENKDNFELFFFVTYLYYTTSVGLPGVAEKAVLIPTAHDEPYIHFSMFKDIFSAPQGFVFLTDEEQNLVHHLFGNENILYDTMAVGIDVPEHIDAQEFTQKIKCDNYIIYVGRIDEGKGCHWMFRYFKEYKRRNNSSLKLVLMGKSVIPVPDDPDIINMGFVSEEDKYNGIAGATALILPSKYESLSISALEALSIKTPVIMNGECEVLKGHCIKSNAGLYYKGYFEFEACLQYMENHPDVWKQMGENGKRYVDSYYKWDVIISKFDQMINEILGE